MSPSKRLVLASIACLATACGGSDATPLDSNQTADAPSSSGVDAASEAAPGDATTALTACPTDSGKGSIVAPKTACWLVAPAQVGADASGQNATFASYALAPDADRRGQLVVYFNSSDSHPANNIADPTLNFYTAATSLGYSVIALSYASQQIIGISCTTDSCYSATRQTVIAGAFQSGAAASLKGIRQDEGVTWRLAATLRWLAMNDPSHGWDAFLTPSSVSLLPDQQVNWGMVVTAGHSQGGGHAAMVGKLYSVSRVTQLSSTCDALSGVPASWTQGSTGSWKTNPATFWGLAAPTQFTHGTPTAGDTTCAYHAAVWQNFGMVPARANDNAALCGKTGDTHGASIGCKDNYDAWQRMLQ